MRKVVRILLLSFIFIIPIHVNADDNNKVEVYFNIPANITFKNEDLVKACNEFELSIKKLYCHLFK